MASTPNYFLHFAAAAAVDVGCCYYYCLLPWLLLLRVPRRALTAHTNNTWSSRSVKPL